jgi:hypothetical protein
VGHEGRIVSGATVLPEGLLALIARLRTYRTAKFEYEDDGTWFVGTDQELAHMNQSSVVESMYRDSDRHAVVLDVLVPTYAVPSRITGHYDLFMDIPDGLSNRQYKRLLKALVRAGVVSKHWAKHALSSGPASTSLPLQKDLMPRRRPQDSRAIVNWAAQS